MSETYRMLGRDRQAELERSAVRANAGRRYEKPVDHGPRACRRARVRAVLGALLSRGAVGSALVVGGAVAGTSAPAWASSHDRASTTPAWARPLTGMPPSFVQHD
jgi:hypothetical protein